jgi:poly-gamma-glutamate synthesis protein (capsule biosynthesis protein)
MVRILIGGDLCPIGSNEPLFKEGDATGIFGNLLCEFERADLSIVNLECPLIGSPNPISKMGPVLGVGDACIKGIKNAGIDVLGMANNHIMDHGAGGLENTIRVCDEAGISHVGAGENLSAAGGILVRRVGRIRVGIMSMAEHEFSIATPTDWGANPLDPIDFVRNLREYQDRCDYLIVLVHGGNEGCPYPRPSLMKMCRFFVEEGANAVICQHSHCPGCYERYQDSHIVYGQGNLLFEPLTQMARPWYEGFLISLQIDGKGNCEMEMIPYLQSWGSPGIRLMQKDAEKVFRQAIEDRSESICDSKFVEEQWALFCRERAQSCLKMFRGNESFIEKVINKTGLYKILESKKSRQRKLHLIRCESLRDTLIKILSSQ